MIQPITPPEIHRRFPLPKDMQDKGISKTARVHIICTKVVERPAPTKPWIEHRITSQTWGLKYLDWVLNGPPAPFLIVDMGPAGIRAYQTPKSVPEKSVEGFIDWPTTEAVG